MTQFWRLAASMTAFARSDIRPGTGGGVDTFGAW
jgi:hypothetical protein